MENQIKYNNIKLIKFCDCLICEKMLITYILVNIKKK